MIWNKFLTIATYEISLDYGDDDEKSLLIHTLTYPESLTPICSYCGLKGPTYLFNLLYPVNVLKRTWRTSGKGISGRPYNLMGILYKNKRPKMNQQLPLAVLEHSPPLTVYLR